MPEVAVEGDELVVRLTHLERAESLHPDVRVPRSAIRSVEVLEHPIDAVGGFKVVGSRLPGSFAIGTFTAGAGRRCFAVVHRHAASGLRIELEGAGLDELVVGCDDAAALAATLAPDGGGDPALAAD